jgi:hypothetical protein
MFDNIYLEFEEKEGRTNIQELINICNFDISNYNLKSSLSNNELHRLNNYIDEVLLKEIYNNTSTLIFMKKYIIYNIDIFGKEKFNDVINNYIEKKFENFYIVKTNINNTLYKYDNNLNKYYNKYIETIDEEIDDFFK